MVSSSIQICGKYSTSPVIVFPLLDSILDLLRISADPVTFNSTVVCKMSRIDFNKHRESLLRASKEVFDNNNKINWAVFGYEPQTAILQVVEKGDGDIEEMVDELNSGKIMYAYFRVKDPNSELFKYVLVNWQGEGVPENRKGTFASHFNDVRSFFKGTHLTINARSEDDLEEEDILDKVSKSSGSNYGFHKEVSKPVPEAKPVGSVYKKTLPHAEIQAKRRDNFWEEQQREERQRREEEQNKKSNEFKKLDQERREREMKEAQERDRREAERMKKVREMKAHEKRANAIDSKDEQQKWEATQADALKDEDERRKRSDMMRKQRQAETQQLLSQRENNPRAVFQQRKSQFDDQGSDSSQPAPRRKIQHNFGNNSSSHQEFERKQPITLPTAEPDFDRPSFSTTQSPPLSPAAVPVSPTSPAPAAPVSPSPRSPEPAKAPANEQQPLSSNVDSNNFPKTRNLLVEGLPQRQKDSDEEEEEDDDAWGDEEETAPIQSAPVIPQPEPEPEPEIYEDVNVENDVKEENETRQYEEDERPSDQGHCARALYDYQAADDTEITFDPDDVITNIEFIDDGWWQGFGPDGSYGMFPANYVELI